MEWYEAEVQDLERQRAAGRFPRNSPVFYGSSSIRLWSTLARDMGPAILNLAFGGSTLEACDYFFDRLVKPVEPSSVVIYAGDNDLGDGRSPEQVRDWYRSLAAKVERLPGGPSFGFISIKPSPARWPIIDRIRAANHFVRRDVALFAGAYYIDVFPAMLNAAGGPRSELFEPDGLHMNAAGYQLWTALLEPHRNRIFVHHSSPGNMETVSSGQIAPRVSPVVQPDSEP